MASAILNLVILYLNTVDLNIDSNTFKVLNCSRDIYNQQLTRL